MGIRSPIPMFKFTYKQQNFIALVTQSDITHTLAVCREVVKYLINEQHCDPSTNDSVGSTLLQYASVVAVILTLSGILSVRHAVNQQNRTKWHCNTSRTGKKVAFPADSLIQEICQEISHLLLQGGIV